MFQVQVEPLPVPVALVPLPGRSHSAAWSLARQSVTLCTTATCSDGGGAGQGSALDSGVQRVQKTAAVVASLAFAGVFGADVAVKVLEYVRAQHTGRLVGAVLMIFQANYSTGPCSSARGRRLVASVPV